MAIELKHLRYVLAAAEHHSFRRAAKVLGVNQSAISRRIRDLEDELGASLFNRHSGGVELTYAGQNFIEHARPALGQIGCAASMADACGSGRTGLVRVGIFSSLSSGFISDLLRDYERRHADVRLDFIEGAPSEHLTAIRRYKMDIAFLTAATIPTGCERQHLWTERVFVVVPSSDVLADKSELVWADLRNRHFIVSISDPGPEIHDYLVKHLAQLGYCPSIEKCAVGRDNLMQLVSFRKGLTLTSEATTGTIFPGTVYRPLAGEELPFCAIWSPDNDNPALRRLLSLARVMSARNERNGRAAHKNFTKDTDVTMERVSATSDVPPRGSRLSP